MTVSGQQTVNYTYDDANRLTQITQGSSVVTLGYDAAGRRISLTLPNGILVQYVYDALSRVIAIWYSHGTTVLGNLVYEYDQTGNRTKVGGSWGRTGIPLAVTTTNYDTNNRQLTFGDKTLTYDNNGNLTSILDANGTTLHTWNARNQLQAVSGPASTANFAYDGIGRREQKTVNGSLTEYLYDGVNPVQETSGAAVLANTLTGLGPDTFLTRTDVVAGITSSLLTDPFGSVLALADSSGAIQTEYTYEPFGRATITGAPNTNSFQYTGRENDGTGLYYYRARYYDPALQRFIREDPVGLLARDTNFYAYVGNNPLNRIDPLGLAETCTWFGINWGGCIGIGWHSVNEKGICQDDCGKFRWRTRNCLCFCVGAGLWAGGVIEAGDTSRNIEGWSISLNTRISGSGSGFVPTGLGYGLGMGAYYSWCTCDYVQ
jgi:RHS repeat-associated protein